MLALFRSGIISAGFAHGVLGLQSAKSPTGDIAQEEEGPPASQNYLYRKVGEIEQS